MTRPTVDRFLFDTPAIYQISVQGVVAASWSNRLEGMTLNVSESTGRYPITTLTGELLDQAALAGVLNVRYDMHLPVLSVERLPTVL